ncbi:MAG: glycosyltransferase family 4 protein [Limisphaerales bacterium]
MNIIQITPGAGGMFCGNCFRDNALVRALRQQGHATLMLTLYLPMTLEEEDQGAGVPIFFSGVNVYLEQKSAFFRHAPGWLHRLLGSRALLNWAATRAAKTRAADVGELTLSMLRGEEGNQVRELDELIGWLKQNERPDVICLSNALLVGMARRLKRDLGVPVVAMLQGEDSFLDGLPETHRAAAWRTMAERAAELDLLVAPSRYFAEQMAARLQLPAGRVRIVSNGINLDGFFPATTTPDPPVLGFFARMCREKGVDALVEAFILLKSRDRIKNLKLRVGGGLGPADKPLVEELRGRLHAQGLAGQAEFCPNLDRAGKQAFLRSLSVCSVPALYGEAFGLYVIEALASGVSVVQPRHAAFPELVDATGGGVLCAPNDTAALAEAIEGVLLSPGRARALGEAGRRAVQEKFSAEQMASGMTDVFREAIAGRS